MGYSLNGACYPDGPTALTNFRNLYPDVQAEAISEILSASVNATGLLTYSIQTDDLISNTVRTNNRSVQMPICDYNDVTLGSDYGFSVFIGCALMFALGFIGTR